MGREMTEAAILFFFLCLSCPVTGDGSGEGYVRPLPRQTLSLPWRPKRSSDPQQVTISAIGSKVDCYFSLSLSLLLLVDL